MSAIVLTCVLCGSRPRSAEAEELFRDGGGPAAGGGEVARAVPGRVAAYEETASPAGASNAGLYRNIGNARTCSPATCRGRS